MAQGDARKFFRAFLRRPGSIGALAPSSGHLAARMVEGLRIAPGEHVVEFSLAADGRATPRLEEGELRSLPNVSAIRHNGNGLALTVTEPHVLLPALLGLLGRTGATLTQLSIRHASLEDVFVKLTGRHLRDGGA